MWIARDATVCFAKINRVQDNLRSKRYHNISVIHWISNQSWNKNKQNSHLLQDPSKWSIWLSFKIAIILFNCKNLSTCLSLSKCNFCLPSLFKTHVHFSEVFTSHYLLRKAKNLKGTQLQLSALQRFAIYSTIWDQRGITIFHLYIQSVIKVKIKKKQKWHTSVAFTAKRCTIQFWNR